MKLLYICLIVVSLFIRYVLWRKEGFTGESKYYTIKPHTYDGFGAQYQAIMSGIAYSNNKGLTYVHTPFEQMSHGVDINKLNDFIGLRSDTANMNNIKTDHYSKEVHCSNRPSEYYTSPVLKILRDAYYSTEKPNISPPDIAMHIRRGDVDATQYPKRFTANEENKRIINILQEKYPNYTVKIFSEGKSSDFDDLVSENVVLHLNGDITETFHSLVTAKVLVTAKSSLSYCAAVLNENTVYYQDFWHKPLDHWILL
jgi:hypothetical protein